MKKILALLLLFLHILLAADAQMLPESDLYYRNLRGNVKEICSERYGVSDSTGKQVMTWFFSENERFNKTGNLIYSSNKNTAAHAYFNDSTCYTYDSLQNLLMEEVFEEHGLLEKRTTSTYNTKGQTLTETELEYDIDDDSGLVTDTFLTMDKYSCNDLGLVAEIRRSSLQADGTISPYRLYIKNVYEDSGRERVQYEFRSTDNPDVADTVFTRKDMHGKEIEWSGSQTHSTYSYDSAGRISESYQMAVRGNTVFATIVYTYDKWGNQNSITTYDSTAKVVGVTLTSTFYDVDRKGNWRKVKGYKDGKFVYYCKRKIKYY